MASHYKPKIVTSGLVMNLDVANPRSYHGLGNDLTDLTGRLNSGSFVGSPTYDADYKGSIVVSGSYISIPNSSDLNNSQFTFSGWFLNSATTLNWNRFASKKNAYDDANGYEISLETGSSNKIYVSGVGATFAIINTINWIGTGWHNLAVTFDNSTVTVYCDGNYCGQGSIFQVVPNTRPLFIGKINSEAATQWVGKIANVSMHNIVLTSTQIFQNYNALKGRFLGTSTVAGGNNVQLENGGYFLMEDNSYILVEN